MIVLYLVVSYTCAAAALCALGPPGLTTATLLVPIAASASVVSVDCAISWRDMWLAEACDPAECLATLARRDE